MKVGDFVRYFDNPQSVPCKVLEIIDFKHGKGKKRVKIMLPILGLTRYCAEDELMVVKKED